MELQECLLTEKELKLLRTVEKILASKEIKGCMALTGSLALAIQGIKKPREADDIDICDYACDPWDLLRIGGGIRQITGASDEYSDFFCEFSLDGDRIHYLEMNLGELDDECLTVYHGNVCFKVLKAQYILEYKLRHSYDTDHGNPLKHKRDLIYILTNN